MSTTNALQTGKTVRGLNIATLVLTILSLVAIVAGIASVGVLAVYVQDNSAELAKYVNISTSNGSSSSSHATNSSSSTHSTHSSSNDLDITINGEKVSAESLARAFAAIDDENLSTFAQLLNYVSAGDYASTLGLMSSCSYSDLVEGRDEIASLTDAELQEMSAASGISVSALAKLRSEVGTISDSDLSYVARYIGDGGAQNMVNDGSAAIAAVLLVILVFLLVINIVALIASILALRNYAKPEKLGAAFVLAIIAAVLCLATSWIRTVLFIISAVFIYKTRKAPAPVQSPGAYV